MRKNNHQIGQLGENLAAEYLTHKGYRILERNWGSKWGEIDLICQDGQALVFVEVKTKRGLAYGCPEEMVNSRKLKQIKRISSLYAAGNNCFERIDVVAVVLKLNCQLESIHHYLAVY